MVIWTIITPTQDCLDEVSYERTYHVALEISINFVVFENLIFKPVIYHCGYPQKLLQGQCHDFIGGYVDLVLVHC